MRENFYSGEHGQGMNYKSFCPKTWDDINMCNTYARNFNSDKEEWTVHVTGLTKVFVHVSVCACVRLHDELYVVCILR